MGIRDFFDERKTISLKQLIIVIVIFVVVISGASFLYIKLNANNMDKVVKAAADEAMVFVVEADEDANSNNTIFKAARDWNKDNKDTGISVSANKINDCLIVEAVYKEKSKGVSKSGDCSDLREVKSLNTSDVVETINGDTVFHNGDTVVVSADGFLSSNGVVVELVAPDGESMVSETIVGDDGSVSAEFLIPGGSKYLGVWKYSIKGEQDTFNVENSFIVE